MTPPIVPDRRRLVVLVFCAALTLSGCQAGDLAGSGLSTSSATERGGDGAAADSSSAPAAHATRLAAGTRTTGIKMLRALTVAPPSHASTYDRDRFGGWIDADSSGCDTRAEVLMAESTTRTTETGTCTVKTGTWRSWYDGVTWKRATGLDIDHIVALKEVWLSGAWSWSAADRRRYANDLDFAWTLDAVTATLNRSKSDKDAAEWLPKLQKCTFARHVVAVKYRWGLAVDTAEKAALARILTGTCGAQSLTVPAPGR